MKKKFVWTRNIERKISEAMSSKAKRLNSNSDAIVQAFSRAVEGGEHYYTGRAMMYELSRDWIKIEKSSIFRALERNNALFDGVGLIFNAIELQKVINAPPGSILIPGFDSGGFKIEVIKPNDPDYKEAFFRLPGAT
jgi:hypothetical protein